MSKRLEKPIFIIGAARSGTTMLSHHLLAHHPAVAFWSEPAHVWRFGHAYRSSDRLTARDVTPRIRAFIVEQFSAFLRESGKSRFMEKTPSNCFRLPFIFEIFPDAKFVHILRDGRDVAASASLRWRGDAIKAAPDHPRLNGDRHGSFPQRVNVAVKRVRKLSSFHRIGRGHLGLNELPAHLPTLGRTVMRAVFPGRAQFWGPRFPGIKDVHRTYSLLETCAIQWDCSVRTAIGFGRNLGPDQYLEIRYEDFFSAPEEYLRAIHAFLQLDDHPRVYQQMKTMIERKESIKRGSGYVADELKSVMDHIAPTLHYLGYVE